jgi:hypothetical protein
VDVQQIVKLDVLDNVIVDVQLNVKHAQHVMGVLLNVNLVQVVMGLVKPV